ncbi:hypothetical protein ABKN59_004579 [Abortiporus biennis]
MVALQLKSAVFCFINIALLVTQGNAFTLNHRHEDGFMDLFARQSSSSLDSSVISVIPPQCQSFCSTIVSNFSDASCQASNACLCTEANNKAMASCFDCLYPLIDQSKQTLAGTTLKNFEDQCKAAGFSLSTITVTPGADPAAGQTSGAGQVSANIQSGLILAAAIAAGGLFIGGM